MTVCLSREDGVALITLDRPPANAMDAAFLDELARAVEEARFDGAVEAVVISSALDTFFSAGSDVRFFARGDVAANSALCRAEQETFRKIERTAKPVVAAIAGHCLGAGLELALACRARVASEGDYRIGLPEVRLGLAPGSGGTQRLPRLVGRQRALALMLRGGTLAPREALAAGIVDEVVPRSALLHRARALVRAPQLV